MKSAPPFDRVKASEDFTNYLRRSYKESGREFVLTEFLAKDKNRAWMDVELKAREKFWSSTWRYQQIDEGGRILDSMLSGLSADTRELIEDYLESRRDEAYSDGYKENHDENLSC